jgi:tRNA dimethylallyltransferase
MAFPIINQLHDKNKLVYLVGGSGFYLQALLQGMYDSPTTPKETSERSDKLYQQLGISPFLEILALHDPATLNRYHANDHYRVRRAVEHFWNTGTPLSEARSKKDEENQSRKHSNVHGWDVLHLHLDIPKEEHSEIITKRTQKMLKSGLIQEVQDLLGQGFTGNEKPLQSIGYKEVINLERGIIKSEAECLERIMISTRQLAKSQRTWFNRIQGKVSLHPMLNKALILDSVDKFIHL